VSNIHERLMAAFQIEYKEHLQAVRAMLDDLERRQYDTTTFDFVESHRRVHSLKGAARAVGLRQVEALAHRLETLVSRCQTGETKLDHRVASVIKRAFDEIEDRAAALGAGPPPDSASDIVEEVERLIGKSDGPRRSPEEIDAQPARPSTGSAASPKRVAKAGGRSTDSRISDESARDGVVPAPDETARVNVGNLDAVLRRAGEILVEIQHHESIAQELRELRRGIEVLERDSGKLAGWSPQTGATVAADGAEVRSQSNLADTVSKTLNQVKRIGQSQQDAIWRLRRTGAQLYQGVRALRIVPAESVFGGLRKMARDLARQENKQIEVDVGGLDTLVDRRVLQTLKDPILHLLRNAVSHGIEPSETRVERGKSAAGHVAFSVGVQRNRLFVRLEDDGHGLNLERIGKEAARLGILPDGIPSSNDFAALTRILVRPSFTTAPGITEIAGRGIGLSVVDKAVRQLQGTFELRPRPQGGTVATISVPLTVAGNRLLLAQCKEQTYGIPLQWVERLLRVPSDDIKTIKGEPAIVAGGGEAPVPLISLAQLLGYTDISVKGDGKFISAVLLKSDESRLAVAVDAFVAVQDSVVQDLDAALSRLDLIAGGVMLRDGSVSLVVNPPALIANASDARRQWLLDTRPEARARATPLVLVVDDSITTRTLEKSILEAKGFQVRLSVDGVDALEQLRQERVDLVIVDVEMPRMDGFGLLHAMKRDERLVDIPVVLVTSRDSPQDRRKGLALGAEAYIVKQSFDQTRLLEAIEQIL